MIRVPLPDGVPASATARGREHHRHGFDAARGSSPPPPPALRQPLASNVNWDDPARHGRRHRSCRRPPTASTSSCPPRPTSSSTSPAGSPVRTRRRATDGLFVPTEPTRLLDTRQPNGPSGGPRLWSGGGREVDVSAVTGGAAAAVVANLTVVDSDGPGFWLAHAAGPAVRHGVVDQHRRHPGDAGQPGDRARVHPRPRVAGADHGTLRRRCHRMVHGYSGGGCATRAGQREHRSPRGDHLRLGLRRHALDGCARAVCGGSTRSTCSSRAGVS